MTRKFYKCLMIFITVFFLQSQSVYAEGYKERDYLKDHIIFNDIEQVFQNTTSAFICSIFGQHGCAFFVSYSASDNVVKQIENLTDSELDQYTQSVGGVKTWIANAITLETTEMINAGVVIILILLLIIYLVKYNYSHMVRRVSLFFFTSNILAVFAIVTIVNLPNNKPISYITMSWLWIGGTFWNIAEQMNLENFDNKRLYLESIKVPDVNNKILETQELLRFGLCVASRGGADISLNFSKIDDSTLRATADYKYCTLQMNIGYDSNLQNDIAQYGLSVDNFNEIQKLKLKASVDILLQQTAAAVQATTTAYATGSSAQTIEDINPANLAQPVSRKDSYVYATVVPMKLSATFIKAISDVTPSPALIGRQAELCESAEQSGGRPFYRPGEGAKQVKDCVAKACDQSLYSCASALYFEKQLTFLQQYRAKGIAQAGIFLIKDEIEIDTTPRNFGDKFTAKFVYNNLNDSTKQTNTNPAIFSSKFTIAKPEDFDESDFMYFSENRKNEFNKLFDDEDYSPMALVKSDNGFLNLDKFNVCSKIENQNTYAGGYSCGSATSEMTAVGRSIIGFVTQVKFAVLSNKMANKSQFISATDSIQKAIAKKMVVQAVGAVAIAEALDTDLTPSMYADFDSKSAIYSNALKAASMVFIFNEKSSNNLLAKLEQVGYPAGFLAYSFRYFLYLIVSYGYVLFIGSFLTFTLLSPLLVFYYVRFASQNKENAIGSALGLMIDSSLSFVSYMLGLVIVLTIVPITVSTYISGERIAALGNGGGGFANTFSGLLYMIFCGFITLFFYIYYAYKGVYEGSEAVSRIENNISGKLQYEAESAEKQLINVGRTIK